MAAGIAWEVGYIGTDTATGHRVGGYRTSLRRGTGHRVPRLGAHYIGRDPLEAACYLPPRYPHSQFRYQKLEARRSGPDFTVDSARDRGQYWTVFVPHSALHGIDICQYRRAGMLLRQYRASRSKCVGRSGDATPLMSRSRTKGAARGGTAFPSWYRHTRAQYRCRNTSQRTSPCNTAMVRKLEWTEEHNVGP
eukprot:3625347-Rhodomonas_salina.1